MHRALSTGALVLIVFMVPLVAQQDFSGLSIKPGDVVYVTDPSGTQTVGPLTSVSPSMLSIDGHDFTPAGILRIERRGDALWDGAAIGLGSGAGVGAFLAMGECGVDWPAWRCAAEGAAWGALFGALIDWRHQGRTLIFGIAATRTSSRLPGTTARTGRPEAAALTVRVRW